MTVGTFEITAPENERETDGDILVFDPTPVVDGIELSDDPVLEFRSRAHLGVGQAAHRRRPRRAARLGGYSRGGGGRRLGGGAVSRLARAPPTVMATAARKLR